MKTQFKKTVTAIALVAATALVHAGDTGILTNKAGMTLYTFDKDQNGKSVCYDGCALKWPPYLAATQAKERNNWGLSTRRDGSKQWTYKGQPLYTWIGDSQVGDTKGDGIGGVWHVVKKVNKSASYSDGGGKDYRQSTSDRYGY
ncbi:MAG: hypothetical protein AAFZ92_03965 [Pseudomonadota bacterium]